MATVVTVVTGVFEAAALIRGNGFLFTSLQPLFVKTLHLNIFLFSLITINLPPPCSFTSCMSCIYMYMFPFMLDVYMLYTCCYIQVYITTSTLKAFLMGSCHVETTCVSSTWHLLLIFLKGNLFLSPRRPQERFRDTSFFVTLSLLSC